VNDFSGETSLKLSSGDADRVDMPAAVLKRR